MNKVLSERAELGREGERSPPVVAGERKREGEDEGRALRKKGGEKEREGGILYRIREIDAEESWQDLVVKRSPKCEQ